MSIMRYNKDRMVVKSRLATEKPLHLPPPEVWRFTPGKDTPLPVPVDERGLVDIDRLIELVQSTVEPEFTWQPSEKPDAHHIYWEHNNYPDKPEDSVNPEVFYGLPINQIVIPRMFHNWLHLTTEPPPIPSREAMHHRILAHNVVRNLLRNARQSLALTKASYIREDRLHRGSEYHLWQFLVEVEEAQKLPSEFSLVDLTELDPSTPEELHSLASFLGRAISRANRTRAIQKGLAASSLQNASARLVL